MGRNPITRVNNKNPIAIIVIPDVVKILVPNLSESLPLKEEISAIVRVVGSKNSAVVSGSHPNINCR